MSLARKLLLAMFLIALTGTAFGAGTFASFSASTTNAGSTFATGTLVLKDKVDSGSFCYSTASDATTQGTNTDTNANANCAAVITQTLAIPGTNATANVQIINDGSVAAAGGLKLNANAGCTSTNDAGTYHGSSDPCGVLQLQIQQTLVNGVSTTACIYGKGSSAEINGTAITFPLSITNGTDDSFKLTVDGTAYDNIDFAASNTSFTDSVTLTTAINAALTTAGAPARAAVGLDNILYITANSNGLSSPATSLAIAAPGNTKDARTKLAITSPTATSAGGEATCGYDPAHNLLNFSTAFPNNAATPVTAASTLATGGTGRTYQTAVSFPLAAGNSYQGKISTFGFTWTAKQ